MTQIQLVNPRIGSRGEVFTRKPVDSRTRNFSINFWKHLNILKKYTRDVHITTKHIFMLIYAYRHVERKDMRLRGWWCWWVWCRTDRGEGRGESACDIPGFPVRTWLWYSVSHSGWNRVDTAECTCWLLCGQLHRWRSRSCRQKSEGPPKTRAGTLYKRTTDPEANVWSGLFSVMGAEDQEHEDCTRHDDEEKEVRGDRWAMLASWDRPNKLSLRG